MRTTDPMLFVIAMFLAAFILLFIPSISIPITKTIYLMRLDFISSGLLGTLQANGRIEFGVWGYCVFPITAVALGNSVGLTTVQCSKAKLGYTFDNELVNLTGLKQAAELISKTTSTGLVLHPISCALSFVALIACIITVQRYDKGRPDSGFLNIIATVAAYLGAVLATIAFIFDCVLYGVARNKLNIVSIRWGNAISLTIVGAIAMWLGALGITSRMRMMHRWKKTMSDASQPDQRPTRSDTLPPYDYPDQDTAQYRR